jgi:outer membrane protein OmpA-like peptidoglycan-associated protein
MSGHHAALVPRFLAFLGAAVLVAVSLCGCGAFQMPRVAGGWVTPHRDPPSVLAVVLNVRSQAALATFRGLVTATARTGEHLIVLSAANGASLGTFAAPVMPRVAGPAWPAPLRPGATAFERASYRNAVTRAKGILQRDEVLLRRREQQALLAWAHEAVTASLSNAARPAVLQDSSPATALTAAAADISTLEQTGLEFGSHRVIAVIGGLEPPPSLRTSLDGMTVAVVGVPSVGSAAAWQSSLLQAGAGRVLALTSATEGQLAAVVEAGLGGQALAFQLARIGYRPAQYTLPLSVDGPLRQVLHLLAVSDPDATATIYGYTDDIPVPGGNLLLSWKRAHAVQAWLSSHGIRADRMLAVGLGTANPVARNGPAGQPLNRRVVIIVSPAT